MRIKLGIPSVDKLRSFLKQYKFVLIVLLAGLVLLAIPTDKTTEKSGRMEGIGVSAAEFSVEELEKKLSRILSRIEGAGEVEVMLTVRTGMERTFAADRETVQTDKETELKEEMVIISTDYGEEAILIRQNYPVFQGALIVCQGGDDPSVCLRLTQALAALTGLGTGRITVCKGS